MNLQTIPYHSYEKGLPQEGNFILGQLHNENLIVYQAFNDQIADYAVKNQRFGGNAYSFERMTWIKPNFLWMMYRSGWAEKEDQNRILAIEITLKGFEELLAAGVMTTYDKSYGDTINWKKELNRSHVRIQWDPDHGPKGGKLSRRAVQIGIKDAALHTFNNEFIQSITDITDFVREQKKHLDDKEDTFFVINEHIIEVNDSLKQKFAIPQTFVSPYIQGLISEFERNKAIGSDDFEKLLVDAEEEEQRKELVGYIKNYEHAEFSRYLLKTAIAYRKEEAGTCGCMCEDLLLFSYFASKNKSAIDFDMILEAKYIDFDTWCGFDGEMVFYTLGYQGTKDYLKENADRFSKEAVEHFLGFDEKYLYNEINDRAFWYM